MNLPKPTPRWRLIVALLIAIGVVAVIIAREYRIDADFPVSQLAQQAECETLKVLPDGSTILLCPPPATSEPGATDTATPEPGPTDTETAVLPTDTSEPTPTGTATPEPGPTDTPAPTETTAPTGTPSAPFASAPLCPDHGSEHNHSGFHTMWDSARACHFDHEHGKSPLGAAFAAAFAPLGDWRTLQGNREVGHTNPSSPIEFTDKGGGEKWYVHVPVAHPGAVGFEGAAVGICDVAAQVHNFGDYSRELEGRLHTANVFLHQCMGDQHGYLYTVQIMDYGQRVVPYQGPPLLYPDNFLPLYDGPRGPYVSIDCDDLVAPFAAQCASTSAVSKWTSKPTGPASSPRPQTSSLLQVLFDVRGTYQVIDWSDQTYPFTWLWNCSSDGGLTYNPVGCRFNNAASELHEIAGTISAAWDNAANFDTDPRPGRISGEAFVTAYGTLLGFCPPGMQCYPIKMVNAFVGKWGADLCAVKCSLITPANTPSRDIFFCGQTVCSETTPGAVPSGWVGSQN